MLERNDFLNFVNISFIIVIPILVYIHPAKIIPKFFLSTFLS